MKFVLQVYLSILRIPSSFNFSFYAIAHCNRKVEYVSAKHFVSASSRLSCIMSSFQGTKNNNQVKVDSGRLLEDFSAMYQNDLPSNFHYKSHRTQKGLTTEMHSTIQKKVNVWLFHTRHLSHYLLHYGLSKKPQLAGITNDATISA